jgi:uncharacterized damage-inducible protein DinB
MKELVRYYARCNTKVNKDMGELLARTVPDPLNMALDGYFFKTLGSILEHIYIADRMWMNAFASVDTCGMDFEAELGPMPKFGERIFTSFEAFSAARSALDAVIERYMDSLPEEYFGKRLTRINRKGEQEERDTMKAVVHFFNHQTHHRGQVSAILDTMKIENDFSNMIRID